MFGLSLPFPVCFTGFSGAGITWLGVVPPILALATALIYLISAENVKFLYERKSYGFHGFHFICLFIYKYFLDTSFAFISIRRVYGNHYVFSYTGESFLSPLILTMFIIGIVSVILFAAVIPILFLVYIYRPQKRLHLANAFTFGLKTERIYLWHGVWDIWRRLPFVAINLFISVSTVSILVLLHCLMVLVVLTVHCVFKPYKKESINFIEVVILFCLLGATLAILDENDIYIGRTTSIFFITIPFIYALVVFIYYIFAKLYRRKNPDFSLSALLASKLQQFSPSHKPHDQSGGEEKPKEPTDPTAISKSEQLDASGIVPLREPLLEMNS
ncbi:PREDICTED: uncharacterized protein LOC109582640 [Amphimedon queenslandica]|nr:PREDICTED: uncharacterized protein LOC109582640 [Amphimedon queenslandica]|eukprot:XP_019853039.1 PREDICTED: uncharacterized protein LOC109582640 [Amphimedon queenslandica]